MAFGWSCLFHRLVWPGATSQHLENGGLTVDAITILALLVAVVLAIYLAAAMLVPEKFS